MTPTDYATCIARRRAFALPGYASYAQAGFDGEYVSPYHLTCGNLLGPVLISYNWLDAPSAHANNDTLKNTGHLPDMIFNKVLDAALHQTAQTRADIYVTHAFHMLPATRSAVIPMADVEASFDAITRHEVHGRPVTALGRAAASMCARFDIAHDTVPHPSARGLTMAAKARHLSAALKGQT